MFRIALLSFFLTLSAALADSAVEELCTAGDCGAVQSHSLLQRKHVSSANAQPAEEKAKPMKKIEAPACEGVESDERCWYLSDKGENCEATCLKHGRSFSFKAPVKGKPIMPMLLNKEPQKEDGPWRAFECYKPEEDHLTLVSSCSANDYRDNQGSWSDPSCQLACPCGGVKECSWKQPEACTPVFQFKDNQYTGCPKVDSDKPWCSHDHDKSDEWSYCVYACTDAAAGGAVEMFSEPPEPDQSELTEILKTPDAVSFKVEEAMPFAADMDFKDIKDAIRSEEAQKAESRAPVSNGMDLQDDVSASAPLGPLASSEKAMEENVARNLIAKEADSDTSGKEDTTASTKETFPIDDAAGNLIAKKADSVTAAKTMDSITAAKTTDSVTAAKKEVTAAREGGLQGHDSAIVNIMSKESQNTDTPVNHATVGLDSDGDSVFSEQQDEHTGESASPNSGDAVQTQSAAQNNEKNAASTNIAPLKAETVAPKLDDAMHEEKSKEAELEKEDSVNYAAMGAQQDYNGTGSKDESSASYEVVEQHDHSSDPEKEKKGKEEKSESKDEKDKGKDKEDKKEDKKDSEKSDTNSSESSDGEGPSEKGNSHRPTSFFLSMLMSALILGRVLV